MVSSPTEYPHVKLINSMANVPGMDEREVVEFLSGGRSQPLRLASKDDKEDPVIHPVWFVFEDGKLYISTGRETRKAKNTFATDRIYFSIDTNDPPYKGVKGKAKATIVDDPEKALRINQNIVKKYLGDSEDAKNRIAAIKSASGNSGRVIIELSPLYFTTWDYSKMGQSKR